MAEDYSFVSIQKNHHGMIKDWLLAYGFDPETADVYRKPKTAGERMCRAIQAVAYMIHSNIERYGPTGYGNKPPEMGVVEYWLAHVNYDRLKERRFQI